MKSSVGIVNGQWSGTRKAFVRCLLTVYCLLLTGTPILAGSSPENKTAPESKEETLLQLIENKKKELDAREVELNEREKRLNQLNQDIETKIAQYKKMLREMDGYFKKMDAAEAEKVSHLVKIYESMPPKDAASRIEQLDEDTAVLVLSRMKQRSAAKVMSFIEPGLAAGLSRGLVKTFKVSEK